MDNPLFRQLSFASELQTQSLLVPHEPLISRPETIVPNAIKTAASTKMKIAKSIVVIMEKLTCYEQTELTI